MTGFYTLMKTMPVLAANIPSDDLPAGSPVTDLYRIFKDPADVHRPFVRWWWNGDKVEKGELARNCVYERSRHRRRGDQPIKFPARTDDMGRPAIQWLSPEWVDLLDFTLKEGGLPSV